MNRVQLNSDILYNVLEYCCLREIFIIKVLVLHQTVPDFIREHRKKYIDSYIYDISKYKESGPWSGEYDDTLSSKVNNAPRDIYMFICIIIPYINILTIFPTIHEPTYLPTLVSCTLLRYYICYSDEIKKSKFSQLNPLTNEIPNYDANEDLQVKLSLSIFRDIICIEQSILRERTSNKFYYAEHDCKMKKYSIITKFQTKQKHRR